MDTQHPPGGRRNLLATAAPWAALAVFFVAFYAAYFAPVLVQGFYLAPGDGEVFYLPFFDLPIGQTWNSNLLSGYSVVSDIQSQLLYPLRWISPSFNALVILGYAVSAFGMFGLALRLTGSRLGALLAALVVSGSGFMVGHLGHLSIVHAAAWAPAMLWALACMRDARSRWPVALGAAAVAMCVYGGHPQVSIIGLVLAGCYGVHEIAVVAARRGRGDGLRMLAKVSGMFALGLMLAAPALLPLAHASSEGARASWSLNDFDSFSHTWGSLRLLAFPNLYGAFSLGVYGSYGGPWNLTELAIYAGVAPWLLALAALLGARPQRAYGFWFGALALGLLLCLGASTPLGEAVYHLPVLGKFRAQARFGIVVIIALAVLAAYGVSALMREPLSKRRLAALLGGSVALIAAALASVALDPKSPLLDQGLWSSLRAWPALLFFGAGLVAVGVLAWRRSQWAALLLIAVTVVDLGSFGWLYEWRYSTAAGLSQIATPQAKLAVDDLRRGPGRLLPLNAHKMGMEPLRPNINMQFGIDSVVGYGPLLAARYAAYTGTDTVGMFPIGNPDAPLMDVLGVRWIAGTMQTDYPQPLGRGCGTAALPARMRVTLPAGVSVKALRITSHMNCSVLIDQGRTMARLTLLDAQERALGPALTIDAGEEIAEEAYDREDVRAQVKHQRPPVAQEQPTSLHFLGELPLPDAAAAASARQIQIEVGDTGDALVTIDKVEAIEQGSGRVVALPIAPQGGGDSLGPKRVVPGMTAFAERRGFRGMAWGVCRAEGAKDADIAAALVGAQFKGAPDGRFDPFALALLEPDRAMPALSCRKAPAVKVLERAHGRWRLQVEADGDALAVVSERYNRDWIARVDGERAPVLIADGTIMAVAVPAGRHTLELTYRSRGYRNGLILAALALGVCVLLLVPWRRRRGRVSEAART
ncbi:YfhO family protein [Lysobacter enzymogenes]|uniref:YfhO family protein n=2 Tax=Bacteria TaxID=2 RepID=A0AAU9AEP2_LYSEN|nr:YfhO family protein [Lysobacter enzymogenes]BAV96448.1 hypothetical protein LEN_0961 [Lysobacter enzymogenes]